jgi:DNA-directed RNA polymerase subunit H
MVEIDVMSHQLVPKHEMLSETEGEEILKQFNLTKDQLPKILITDPCVKRIGAKVGQIIRITRDSPTAGLSEFYRVVVDIV